MSQELNELSKRCHLANIKWWLDLSKPCPYCNGKGDIVTTGVIGRCGPCKGLGYYRKDRNIPELLMLCVSELSEAMEGHRKGLQDDKLPHRKMFEVELADCLIRIFDIAGGCGLDLAGAFEEKMQYNATREDHRIENRLKEGGEKY